MSDVTIPEEVRRAVELGRENLAIRDRVMRRLGVAVGKRLDARGATADCILRTALSQPNEEGEGK